MGKKKRSFFEASEKQAYDTRDNPPFGHKRLKKKKESEKKKVSLKKKAEKQTYSVHTKKKKNC